MSGIVAIRRLGRRLRAGAWWLPVAAAAGVLTLSPGPPAAAQDVTFTTDFETGNLAGWQQHGEAFRYQPTRGDNPTARDRGQPSNHQGNWWIGTFERYQGRRGERAGSVQGDGPTGYLQSREFTIPRGSLTFLVGGGAAFETRVELIALNRGGDVEFRENRVYHASGANSETMRSVTWDLDPYAGARGFIRIVDNASGPWGHINADHFRFTPRLQTMRPTEIMPTVPGVIEPVRPATVTVPDFRGRNLRQAYEIAQESGLNVEDVGMVEPGYREGPVIRQSPEPGTRLARGSGIVLVLGPRPRVRVPDVIGMDIEQAARALERNRLRRGEAIEQPSDRHRTGAVTGQEPPPGAQVEPGTAVTLTVAVAVRQRVEVPPLVGRPRADAGPILRESGLVLAGVEEQISERRPGIVLAQSPGAGEIVAPETGVRIVVAIAPPPRVADRPPAGEQPPTGAEPPADEEPPTIEEPPVREEPPAAEEPPGPRVPGPGQGPGWRRFGDPVWIGAVVAALILGALAMHGVHRQVDRRRRRRAPGNEVTFRPHPDPGRPRLETGSPAGPEFELRLRPVRDPGKQRIEPSVGLDPTESDEP